MTGLQNCDRLSASVNLINISIYFLHCITDSFSSAAVCHTQSVTLCIVALRVCVEGWKLYRRVPSRQLPINVFSHFCCRMYRLATKFSEKFRTAEITSQCRIRLRESKMQAARCAVSGTVCEQKVLSLSRPYSIQAM